MSIFDNKYAFIIEDDPMSIKVLTELLNQLGIASTAISDSYTVMEQIKSLDLPDVVFLDLEMPRSNGYTVLEYLRSNPDFDDIPIVAYTTHISHLNDAQRAGFHSFLGKPIDGDRFPEHLANILSGIPVWEVPS